MREWVRRNFPSWVVQKIDRALFWLRQFYIQTVHRLFRLLGFNIVRSGDFYSPLPRIDELQRNIQRWNKPSSLVGLDLNLMQMKSVLLHLHDRWGGEFKPIAEAYPANRRSGFGLGYPKFDARVLYYLIRELRPKNYLEIGSGLSTLHAYLAAKENLSEGASLRITCVEPYPFQALRRIPEVDLIQDFAQNVPIKTFNTLGAGDFLFIDSSHALKIDSDVSYLFLEVLPALNKGVYVHIHDVPFPFNIPFPPDTWLFGERWPIYWNEAMLVQAFLAFNSAYEIILSAPAVRFADEAFFISTFPDYVPLSQETDYPFSSLWIRKVK
jgi:hypothetical protein